MKPPKQDYCTFYFEGPFFKKGSWAGCCYSHDEICLLSYEYRSSKMRLEGDRKLYQCVKAKGHPVHAAIMYMGVRVWYWVRWWLIAGVR